MTSQKNVAVCVLSFDGFSDLWKPFFDHFYSAWSQCPYPVYLVANHKTFDHPQVTTVLTGCDIDWSTNLRTAVTSIPEERILFLFDDWLPIEIDGRSAQFHIEQAVANDWPYLTLYPNNYRTRKVAPDISEISKDGIYRCTLLDGLIRKDFLLDLLIDGENAWEFELRGGQRARETVLYSVDKRIFRHHHLIRKGVWMRRGYQYLMKRRYVINQDRPVETFPAFLLREGKEFLFRQYHRRTPPKLIEYLESRR